MDTLVMCYQWLFDTVRSFYLFLYHDAGWIGISILGISILKRLVNLIRRAHGS